MKFTVLLPVYKGDNPNHLQRAIQSVTTDQTLKPTQIVIVVDGPVPCAIKKILKASKKTLADLNIETTIVYLNKNQGLAIALDKGLEYCKYECVARADADDISIPTRFETQIPLMEKYDLIGSNIIEFETNENHTTTVRKMPNTQDEITQTAKLRSPYAHPTVVYKKTQVTQAGGYQHVNKLEDYYLFVRMLMNNIKTINIDQNLVKYRTGSGAYSRRGGFAMLKSELVLQKKFNQIGFTTKKEMLRNIIIRATYRLIPTFIRKIAYTFMVKTNWNR